MKVAITGASGYLGRSLVEAYLAQGHEVICLCRRSYGSNWTPYALGDDPDQLPWDDVDALVHAAYDFSAHTWRETMERNVRPGIGLFDAAARHHVGRVIFISSLSSFPQTTSCYGRAKFALEEHVIRLGGRVVRPGLVWCDEPGGIMAAMQTMARKLPVIPYPAGGRNNAQYLVHRADVATAVVWLTEHAEHNTPITPVAHPSPWRIHEIIKSLGMRTGHHPQLIPVPWPMLYAPLRAIEMFGIRMPLRSDSLWGLVHGNPNPDLDVSPCGVEPRPFE